MLEQFEFKFQSWNYLQVVTRVRPSILLGVQSIGEVSGPVACRQHGLDVNHLDESVKITIQLSNPQPVEMSWAII